MSWPRNAPEDAKPWLFLIELDRGTEPLLRILGAFPARGAEVRRMAVADGGETARLEVEVSGLDVHRVDHLRRRLQQSVVVRSVATGWRG